MATDPLIGTKLGNYDIVKLIGKGGMAAVYEAHQPSMNRNVAIKVMSASISSDPSFVQRFKNEAQLIARLEHAHILPVYDFGEEKGTLYIVMRYLDAGTLEDRVGKTGMDIKEAVGLFSQLATALDYAHSKGVIHRDLKPGNVLVDNQGNAFLSDFGIAKSLEGGQNLTGTGGVVGTPNYMSPEQGLGGEIDARSDIYALGVILFEMLTGQTPFMGDNPMQVMLKHINDQPPSSRSLNPQISEAVDSVILKALSKDPDKRFKSAKDMAKALDGAYEKGKTVAVAPFETMPVAAVGGGADTMPNPVAGMPQSPTAAGGYAPGTVGVPGVGTPVGLAAAQPEEPFYAINARSAWLSQQTYVGRWLQAVALSLATFLVLGRLTPGDAVQNAALALIPGIFFYGLLNAPIPGALISLGLIFLPLLAHAPTLGLLWLAGVALAGLQMTSREMMLMTVTLFAAGTPFGWLLPLAAPWWLRGHRVAFGTAMGVLFASLFALGLSGWSTGGGLLPKPVDTSAFSNVEISAFDTSYLGLLDPKVWQTWFSEPQTILENIRSSLQVMGDFYLKVKLDPLIVAAAWAIASFVTTIWRKDPKLWMRGAGIGAATLVLLIGSIFHGWAGVVSPSTEAIIVAFLMGPLAFVLTVFPLQAPPPPRPTRK
jgi:serine/threonine-protein kinase